MNTFKKQSGFTLIEIAIVLLIVSILLGYTVAMFSVQTELKQYKAAKTEIKKIKQSLIAFAQVNGRLPCPDNGTDGQEDIKDVLDNSTGLALTVGAFAPGDGLPDGCALYRGKVPNVTLGLSGNIDSSGTMLDPWGQPYWYQVSSVDTLGGVIDLVSPNAIRNVGLTNVGNAELFICSSITDDTVAETDCTSGNTGDPIVQNISAVILSTGKDIGSTVSPDQAENIDTDVIYIKSSFSETAATGFDDVLDWISPNLLYSKMIESGQLP